MKLLTIIGLCLAAAVAGAGATWVADKAYWDNELKVQLSDKDHMIEALNTDLVQLKSGLSALRDTNTAMRKTIDESFVQTVDLVKSNKSALDKLRGVIAGLEQLQKSVAALEAQP